MPSKKLGRVIVASSSKSERNGVMAICARCSAAEDKLPQALRSKRLERAIERALCDPRRFFCNTYKDIGAALVIAGMLAHPNHSSAAVVALEWNL
jgi:hypothetical protein